MEATERASVSDTGLVLPSKSDLAPALLGTTRDDVLDRRTIVYLSSTRSTNHLARLMARAGSKEGTVVIAEHQTLGKGRLDRQWLSPPGTNLLVSLILRPRLPVAKTHLMTMLAAVCVRAAVQECTGLAPDIKWPNDLLLGGRKLAGILCEGYVDSTTLECAIIGIGLNVNADIAAMPDIARFATSLRAETGAEVNRLVLLRGILFHFDSRYGSPEKIDSRLAGDEWGNQIYSEWKAHLLGLGQKVWITEHDRTWTGVAEGVQADGTLEVRCEDGSLRLLTAGDVSLRAENQFT